MTVPASPYPAHGVPALAAVVDAAASFHGFGVEVCGRCGKANRVDAKYCRACGGSLELEPSPAMATVGPAEFLAVPGSFRRGPVKAGGLLYALSISGAVCQLSSHRGTPPRPMAQLHDASAAFNRSAVLDLGRHTRPYGLRGWTLLAAGRSGVEAVSLATGAITQIFSPSSLEPMAVNQSDLDSTGFKGLAATRELCAFATSAGPGRFAMNLLSLDADRPLEQPLTLHGNAVAGVALCGGSFVLCTEEEAGRFHIASRKAQTLNLPANFRPLLTPSSAELTVVPGGMPFAAHGNAQGGEGLLLAGTQDGRTGLLQIDFERGHMDFRPLPRGSALATGATGDATLRTADGVELLGSRTGTVPMRSQTGMAVFEDGKTLFAFAESDFARKHEVLVNGSSGKTSLRFEDARCDRFTCCGVYAFAREFAVAYLDLNSAEGAEMLLARWPALNGGPHV